MSATLMLDLAAVDPPSSPLGRTVRSLSDRLVEIQRPIRVLDAVKWDAVIEQQFFDRHARELPAVTADSYKPLPFDPDAKTREFRDLESDIRVRLGSRSGPGRILSRMCREYREVIDLLVHRGTRHFATASRHLYGTTRDRSTGSRLEYLLACLPLDWESPAESCEPRCDARDAVEDLADRLAQYFGSAAAVRVKLSDGIVADAAAGCDYLKLRRDARFSRADLALLEVHEGWVHLGTTLNGQGQPACTFLSKGPPSSTRTQEGLAVLMEFLTGTTHSDRLMRLRRRLQGIALAEQGADFLEVYRSFVGVGDVPREAYRQTARIFRGSLPARTGPFTKDLSYSEGLVQVARFVWLALAEDWQLGLSTLFCGKTAVEDVPLLAQLISDGLVRPPRYVPELFRDPSLLAARLTDLPFLHVLSPLMPAARSTDAAVRAPRPIDRTLAQR